MNWKRSSLERGHDSALSTLSPGSIFFSPFAWFFADRLIFQPPGAPYPKDHTYFKTLGEDQKKIAIHHRPPSSGKPTEKGGNHAIDLTYHHLSSDLGVDPTDVILVEKSADSGPTYWLASREKHRAVVLISPFLSAFRTVTHLPRRSFPQPQENQGI
jgi:hypothetical protein